MLASNSGWEEERMFINSRLDLLLLVPLLCTPQISTRQNHSVAHPGDRIYLDVVVSPNVWAAGERPSAAGLHRFG